MDEETFKYILDNNPDIYFNALRDNKYNIVKNFLKYVDINMISDRGSTALIIAADREYTDIVKLLLENGADPNIQSTDDYSTALMLAANRGYTYTVKILLEHNVDPNIQSTDDGVTALILAAESDHFNTVKILLENGADPNIQSTDDGSTALILAVENNYFNIVKLLLENGADLSIKNYKGKNALDYCTLKMIKMIQNIGKKKRKKKVKKIYISKNECSVCTDNYKNPRVLTCGHVFCENCINKVKTCPICRKKITTTLKIFI